MKAEFHIANRQRLYAEMADGSAAVLFSGHAPRHPVRNETASPSVEASMAAKHAASMLCGAKCQNSATAEKIVSTCSTASLTEVESDSSTARKYPFMQVHWDINGSPSARMRRLEAAPTLPRIFAAAKSEKISRSAAIVQLTVRQNKKHFVTTERIVSRRFAAIAAVTMRVTARLMPEVDNVTASMNTEKINW